MLIHLIHAQKNKLRNDGQWLRDSMDPFLIPTDRFIEWYRIPPALTINLIDEIYPFVEVDHELKIPLHLRVLATLNVFATDCYQRSVGMDAFCMISQPSISQCIREISTIITKYLAPVYIQFPQTPAAVELTKSRFKTDYGVDGVLGLIDGTQIAVAGISLDFKKAYINYKKFTSINTQAIMDSDMRFINVNARYPGSTQDAFIWKNSVIFSLLEMSFNLNDQEKNIYRDAFLIGDLGYPLQPWLMLAVNKFTSNQQREKRFYKTIRKLRNRNERGFAVLKNRFRCLLKERALHYDHEAAANIIYACATLHNFLINNSFDIDYQINVPYADDGSYEFEDGEIDSRLQNDYLQQGKIVRDRLIAGASGGNFHL